MVSLEKSLLNDTNTLIGKWFKYK